MAKENDDNKEVVEVPLKLLTELQEGLARAEKTAADAEARAAGIEAMMDKGADAEGEQKIRTRKNFEPKFRTVRIRKYPVGGNVDKMDYIIGWTKRGAYQEVDRSGVSPQVLDMIEVIYLGDPKKAEKIRLLDFMNKGEQIHCKILETEKKKEIIETGEEIDVTSWDPQHGLIATGEKVDGYYGKDEITYTIQIPGVDKPVKINGDFVNA